MLHRVRNIIANLPLGNVSHIFCNRISDLGFPTLKDPASGGRQRGSYGSLRSSKNIGKHRLGRIIAHKGSVVATLIFNGIRFLAIGNTIAVAVFVIGHSHNLVAHNLLNTNNAQISNVSVQMRGVLSEALPRLHTFGIRIRQVARSRRAIFTMVSVFNRHIVLRPNGKFPVQMPRQLAIFTCITSGTRRHLRCVPRNIFVVELHAFVERETIDAVGIDQRFNFRLRRSISRIVKLAFCSRSKLIGRQLNISNGVPLVKANGPTKIVGRIIEFNEHIDAGHRRFRPGFVGHRDFKGFWRNYDRRHTLNLLNNYRFWSRLGGNFIIGLRLFPNGGLVGILGGRWDLGCFLFGLLLGDSLSFGLFGRNGLLLDGVVHLINELGALHRLVCAGALREHGHVQEREHQ